jgi:hypothetical protein
MDIGGVPRGDVDGVTRTVVRTLMDREQLRERGLKEQEMLRSRLDVSNSVQEYAELNEEIAAGAMR